MNKTLNLLLTIALIAISGIAANAQASKSNPVLKCVQPVATLESKGGRSEVVFNDKVLKENYKTYAAQEKKNRKRNVQSLNEFRQSLEKDILRRTEEIFPRGQPANRTVIVVTWREGDTLHILIIIID
jgi:uncharacterized protein YecT (DUF1311 family)